MMHILIVGCGLLAATPPGVAPSAHETSLYQAARTEARRDPDAHVRLALWCEAHGMPAERLRHLAIAVLADPTHATARGLLGLVAYADRWQKPGDVQDRVRADAELTARLAEYNGKRAGTPPTADAQWELGLWCEAQGLDAEATAHFTAVTRLDPGREAAWKRLGYRKHDGRWMTDEQVAARRAEAEAQQEADRLWKPRLERWRADLGRGSKRAEAEAGLVGLTDPRAVRSVWEVFALGGEADALRAVQVLGQIDSQAASRALAALAVLNPSEEVRRTATETLASRDLREVIDPLIGRLRDPIRYEVKPVGGPGAPGALFVEGRRVNLQRVYAPPTAPNVPILPTDTISYDEFGLPVINRYIGRTSTTGWMKRETILQGIEDQIGTGQSRLGNLAPGASPEVRRGLQKLGELSAGPARERARQAAGFSPGTELVGRASQYAQIPIGRMALESAKSAAVAQEQLNADVAAIEAHNAKVHEANAPVVRALEHLTDQDHGEDRNAWAAWWTDEKGYAYTSRNNPRPTMVQNVPLAYQPQPVPLGVLSGPTTIERAHSCFSAGTPVWTRDGSRPIESITVGDQVLTQDSRTGRLGYQPVVAVYHNRPDQTLRIDLGGESIVATPIHRFWKAGQGRVMARDLEPGDPIRLVGGLARVEEVEPDQVQPVFNLEVAEGQSFFVGSAGVLVHDNSLVEPVLEPFDAPPVLAKAEADAS